MCSLVRCEHSSCANTHLHMVEYGFDDCCLCVREPQRDVITGTELSETKPQAQIKKCETDVQGNAERLCIKACVLLTVSSEGVSSTGSMMDGDRPKSECFVIPASLEASVRVSMPPNAAVLVE